LIIDSAVYEQGQRRDGQLPLEQLFERCIGDESFVWIGLYEPDEDEFDSVRREFELHELAVEDAITAHQRPKLEVYDDTLFVVLKTARYVDPEEVIEFGEVHLFIGKGFVVTARHGEASELHAVRLELEQRPDLLRCGPGSVLHAIVDKVVDDYVPVINGVDQDISEIEQQVFSDSRHNHAERIYKLKREVVEFHHATTPLLEPLDRLATGRLPLIHEHLHEHFRDVHDHLVRVTEQVEGFRDMLTGVLTANLTQVSVRQNEDVRKISAWAAIIAVPTAIVGVYGMNFEYMPELEWKLGYPLVLVLILVVCTTLHRFFRHRGWL
jgi:magnesium transporter